ncbi:hypothetical protein BGZ80_003488 [Entomortierella chlamydospora]|uniref:Uncharacterized protein n=1 Tax=Entomortierella chlamydospora TaxID=101097 RepID=A0A9P6MP72_9FUNG|nr:hypothetical protein BGZ80_003488 [Entomortierella chlamydospora]
MSTQNSDNITTMADEKHSQPINIPAGSASSSEPIVSPSKSKGNKTGTRSTFCPNSHNRMTTKLTEADFEDPEPPRPKGILEFLGLKKPEDYSNSGGVDKTPTETPVQQFY